LTLYRYLGARSGATFNFGVFPKAAQYIFLAQTHMFVNKIFSGKDDMSDLLKKIA